MASGGGALFFSGEPGTPPASARSLSASGSGAALRLKLSHTSLYLDARPTMAMARFTSACRKSPGKIHSLDRMIKYILSKCPTAPGTRS